jgi:hypothetical protein
MLKYLNILLVLLVPVIAIGGTIVRPYGPSDYAGGAKAVGSKVNSEFATVASFINGKNIASDNITSLGVTNDNMAANSISTTNVIDGAITKAKQTSNYGLTESSGAWGSATNASVDLAQIDNLSTTLTTTGKPVLVLLSAATTGAIGLIQATSSGGGNQNILWVIRDSATTGGGFLISEGTNELKPCSTFSYLDTPVAGTYTYSIKLSVVFASGTNQAFVKNCKLSVQEL